MSLHLQYARSFTNELRIFGEQFTPAQLVWATFAVPYLIVLLSFYPSTRWVRIALLPMGVMALYLAAGCLKDPLMDLRVLHWGNLSAGIRYAFKQDAPLFHPLPRKPLMAPLRQHLPFKAWDIFWSEHRLINISPNPPVQKGRPYFKSILHNLKLGLMYFIIFDSLHLTLNRLAPETFGGCHMVASDFVSWVKNLGQQSGIPWPIIWILFAIGYMLSQIAGLACPYHYLAVFFVGIGYNVDSEWPDFHHGWWKSRSLNEFWGKRYHQTMRLMFDLWTKPFETAPRPIRILAVFIASMVVHLIIFYGIDRQIHIWPAAFTFIGQGFGCIIERYLLKTHRVRVGGIPGLTWAISWSLLWGIPLINSHFSMGWVGYVRRDITMAPESSPVEWFLYALGFPSPLATRSK